MARRKSRTLTQLELEIMQTIWGEGEVAVNDISDRLNVAGHPLALPSIRTMLSILQDKGYVKRRREGRAHLYCAVVSGEQARKRILRDIIQRAFDGSASHLVTALVNARMVSKRELEEARRLIEKREKETKA
ncbi:MAG: BlaI/MecI/CopY family transcriptional regulator [Candidatus Brocadiae bacterium]|nr:BlaI/MecI/CopY family transcriptional regulator [Candidatus Brocadiia bacterium]